MEADLGELRTLLTSPDDGTLAMVVIATVAWIAWAFVAVSMVLEVASRVRGLPAPRLPGLGAPQRAMGQLVTVAALLFITAPTVVAAFPTLPAHAASATPVLESPRLAAVETAPVVPAAAPALVKADSTTTESRPSTTRSSAATACGRSPTACSGMAPGSPRSSS